ncbi:MAG: response regulator [Planctomycetota bacterium]
MSTVLMVDDDMRLLCGLRRAMRNQPFKIFTASCAELAIDLCKRHVFDVIVADHQMRKVNGVELLRWIAANSPGTVRIMLTGSAEHQTKLDAQTIGGVFRFLQKPSEASEIANAIKDGLASQLHIHQKESSI